MVEDLKDGEFFASRTPRATRSSMKYLVYMIMIGRYDIRYKTSDMRFDIDDAIRDIRDIWDIWDLWHLWDLIGKTFKLRTSSVER